MSQISESPLSLLSPLAGQGPEGVAVPLDPSDPQHRRIIDYFLSTANKGPDRYPALHADIARAAEGSLPPADPAADDARIIDLGVDGGGRATSRTWVASRGGAYVSGAVTQVVNAETGEVLASGSATQVGGTMVQVATKTGEAKPAAQKMTAVSFFHSQEAPGTAPRFGVAMATTTTLELDPGLTINVNDPRKKGASGAAIKIGLARDKNHTNSDVDYWYPETSNITPDRLVVPFTGNATLPVDINTSSRVKLFTQLYVTKAQAWMGVFPGFDLQTPVTTSGSTVTWSYPYDNQPIQATKSIQYQSNSLANDNLSAFYFQFQVPTTDPTQPLYTFTVCSKDSPNEPSTNCKQIEDLQYWWHCVAEGTVVTLADGSGAPVETLDNSVSVKARGGATLPVQATLRGLHDDEVEPDPARRLETRGGRVLVLSAHHPVVTPQGLRPVWELEPGDEVETLDGTDVVVSSTEVEYDGVMYNLDLGGVGGGGPDYGSFAANGILVGDHTAQRDLFHAVRHDPERMLPTLPGTHHQDYLSALADATA